MEITKELLEDLYIKQNLSPKTIKGILGCSKNSVKKYLEEFGIEKKNEEQVRLSINQTYQNNHGRGITKQLLEDLYIKQNLSLEEIQNKLNCSRNTLFRRLEEYEIEKDQNLIKLKREETTFKNYGVRVSTQNPNVVEKYKKTCLERYGVDNTTHVKEFQDKKKANNLKKYGVEYSIASKEVQDKIKKTNMERYGCEYPLQSKEIYTKTMQWETGIPQQNQNNTRRKNNTFNSSKPQQDCEKLLIQKFGSDDIITEYQDTRYKHPLRNHLWKCDLYIKSLDLFIECQFSAYHGNEPFDPNNKQHQQKLKQLQIKDSKTSTKVNKSRYYSMIKTWTKSDPLKRETAKKNNLNYKEFFTKQDFYNYFN